MPIASACAAPSCAPSASRRRQSGAQPYRNCKCDAPCLLHNSLNRNRFKDKIMQQFKVLQLLCASEKTRGAVGGRMHPVLVNPPEAPGGLRSRPANRRRPAVQAEEVRKAQGRAAP
ncbi:hypothetical protein GFL38_11990 [Rhizobium leguminosarum bv. viciae]|nr:hypothetical protein [Rhizobium leguminosarum bv. viciae]NKQ70536.1 hypothetical protein [Rhizobium ruizarguesonis]NKQ80311.1 hypothetical protein [Rhizobium ruizarguesonis]TAU28135.1 hypothetical protein ELI48_19315 [Rhizobium ruizarguesonis]TAU69952.1 hypothetical protein ELI45_20060 [Rhizobium ruizarguesonis]